MGLMVTHYITRDLRKTPIAVIEEQLEESAAPTDGLITVIQAIGFDGMSLVQKDKCDVSTFDNISTASHIMDKEAMQSNRWRAFMKHFNKKKPNYIPRTRVAERKENINNLKCNYINRCLSYHLMKHLCDVTVFAAML